ncbi:DC-STAMP domain-containing protein 2 [Nephila pilipes]|uniref:DC-STAMP domain-containing protein 2 n=1 Tax=Nephila pilipes TaxID=299642 RepID=A0A8X6QIE0_NEPPI|nr:DC-STAMP domain-containing protein 2 [Nephila pilipes]
MHDNLRLSSIVSAMVNLKIILRAYRLKRATKRLRRAKENALRIHHGKRPRYPWYEECWRCIVGCLKNYCCKAFCPCCLHPKMIKKDEEDAIYSKSFWRRPCLEGTFENYTVKSFLGFLLGLFLTTGIFFFLLYQLNCNPKITTLICCILGVILTNGLAFKPEFRCIVLLALPSMFSSRGRTVLMAYTYILVMSGPFKNALRNANVLVNSLNCGQEIVIKQTKAILKSIFAPLIAIIDIMRDILKALKEFARMMKEAFIAIRDLFLEIINAIKTVFQWLQSIVSVCSSKYGSPYERCNKAFDDAISDCKVKMGVFKFLCEIVTAIKYRDLGEIKKKIQSQTNPSILRIVCIVWGSDVCLQINYSDGMVPTISMNKGHVPVYLDRKDTRVTSENYRRL